MNKLEEIRRDIGNKYDNKVYKCNVREGNVGVTFSLSKDLVKELRIHCALNGQYVSWVVERAIENYLEAERQKA